MNIMARVKNCCGSVVNSVMFVPEMKQYIGHEIEVEEVSDGFYKNIISPHMKISFRWHESWLELKPNQQRIFDLK